jgi:hypothetical protein
MLNYPFGETMVTLTHAQKIWWATLQNLINKHNIDIDNLNALQAIVRQLALEVIKQLPEQDKIVLFTAGDHKGQILETFPNKDFHSKEDFIKYHQHTGTWGTDSLLLPLLNALGYQPLMHLAGTELPAYLPFVQPVNSTLKIDLVNHGAVYGGYHWELKGHRNPGGGNCMYYMIAQQLQKDFKKVQPLIENVEPLAHLSTVTTKATTKSTTVLPSTPVKALAANSAIFAVPAAETDNVYVKEVKEKFVQLTIESEQRFKVAKTILAKFDTDALITAYRFAVANLVSNDTYLKNRPLHSAEEHDNFIMLNAVTSGSWAKTDEAFLRAELVHALAREAWRNPHAYELLVDNQPKQETPPIAASCDLSNHEQSQELSTTRPTLKA